MDCEIISLKQAIQQFPNCSLHVLKCTSCINIDNISLLPTSYIHQRYTWCQLISCPSCRTCWYICTSCSFQRQLKKEQLSYHHRYHHSNPRSSPRISSEHESLPMFPGSPSNSSSGGSISIFNDNDDFNDNDNTIPFSEHHVFSQFNQICKDMLSLPITEFYI